MKELVTIILPTYNEAENITPLIKEINKVVRNPKEILLVDDSSPDGTADAASAYKKRSPSVSLRVIVRKKDKGLTNSIWEGIQKAKGSIVVWMDCDFSHPPKYINLLLAKIESGGDIVFASRYIRGGRVIGTSKGKKDPKTAVFLSTLMNYFIRAMLGKEFYDYTSGFVAVRKKIFRHLVLRGDYGEYFIDFIYRANLRKFAIIEIPFLSPPRERGASKTGEFFVQRLNRGRQYVVCTVRLLIERFILKTI